MPNIPFELYNNIDYTEMDGNIPPTDNDGHNPPQLNPTVPGHGSSSDGCDIGEGGDDVADSHHAMAAWVRDVGYETDRDEENASMDGNASVNGEEGPEDHLIEVGDLGMVPLRTIWTSLAKHKRCPCRGCICPGGDDYHPGSVASPSGSAVLSLESSMVVEVGSATMSMTSSTPSLISRTTSSSDLVAFTMHEDGPTFHATPAGLFDRPPLWLAPRLELGLFYPASIDDNDFEDF